MPSEQTRITNLSPGLLGVLDRLGKLEGRLLTAEEVVSLRGVRVKNSTDLRRRSTIFGIEIEGYWLYPSFQFGGDGQVREGIAKVLEVVPDDLEGWTLLDWFITPQSTLGRAPSQLLCGATVAEYESNIRKLVALAKYQLKDPLA